MKMGLSTAVRAGRVLGLVAVAASMVVAGALPAAAAAPSHDIIAGAKVISGVPFSETVDTTEATTDAEDAAINANCGAPATNGSVWYSLTAGDVPAYLVDVSQSDFSAGVIVATGTPGNLSLVTCGPRSVGFEVTPGTTYYVMAFSDMPEVVGGQLNISVTEATPPPKVSMVVDEVGLVNRKTGVATVSGTYTCDGQADFTLLQGTLSQKQGDIHVTGNFELTGLECGGTLPWRAEVVSDNEKVRFQRGDAATIALMVGCNRLGCNFYQTLDVVKLRNGH
jgi:hypothetical protein